MTPDLGGGEFWARFAAAALATWRVTHLVAREDGPWDVIARVRAALGHGFLGKLTDCFNCLSIWIAAPFAAVVTSHLAEGALVWVALSGAACLLERATAPQIHVDRLGPDAGEADDPNSPRT